MPRVQDTISPLEEKFCERVIAGDTPTNAALAAGYAKSSCAVTGSRLIRKAKILARISLLKKTALGGVIVPGAADVVLTRAYLLQRLVDLQHGYRDSVAFQSIKLLGQEAFSMFADLSAIVDPSKQSTDDLAKLREKLRKRNGLAV